MTAVGAREPAPARTARSGAPRRESATRAAVRTAWESPVASYYLIASVTLVLLALGLVFVLSSSTVYSLKATGGVSPLKQFLDQAKFALIALPLAVLMSRLPVRVIRAFAWPAYVAAIGLTAATKLMGESSGGNTSWITLAAGIRIQPAEFVKLALALWLGLVLSQRQRDLGQLKRLALPLLGGFVLLGAQLYVTYDLGTVLIMGALMFGALWVAGVPMRVFVMLAVGAASVAAMFATTGETRMARIKAMLGIGELSDQLAWQIGHSLQALGTGGISGVGLGGSRSKWLYLPAAQNDFIFAIIGEELGLMGTLLVLALFAALAVGLARVILRHPDPFVKITTGGIAAWLLAQAVVNIGVVTAVFPVIGVPLPLVSAGGSSLIATLIALGIVLAFARTEPGAPEALRARRGAVRRSFGVLAAGLTGGRR
ncbi:cell division-specific peptidoglycan biosynthesis regulator FtsW [Salana multivorans]|uniref:Probable peptidoglycan glycosyltransferase FtsW n=1 Tax=Salana multivorans TaxID=120377 RepID=A0A3N2D250_9MICO|nr:putative peptidoglycan glycosyltransferase FtsW [Salana multivorans]ROR93843.1 cell division-specific peptidoglycan biosynthesis regulator FtsW [Salana multivorans]